MALCEGPVSGMALCEGPVRVMALCEGPCSEWNGRMLLPREPLHTCAQKLRDQAKLSLCCNGFTLQWDAVVQQPHAWLGYRGVGSRSGMIA